MDQRLHASNSTRVPFYLTTDNGGYTISARQNGVDNLYNSDLPGADLGISGAMGGVSFAFTSDMEDNNTSYKVGYAMGDMTITASTDDEGAADSTNSVGISYKMDAITVSYIAAGDKGADLGDDYDLKLTYSAGALTASFPTNEEDVTKMIATYDLGGATAFFSNKSADGADYQAMGINFSF